MNKQKFLTTVREQFLEDNLDLITLEIDFRTLDSWDSLTGMAILTTIEDDFKIQIPVEDFKQLSTIQQLYDYVSAKL